MGKLIDLTGLKFKTFIVIGQSESVYDRCGTIRTQWIVKCLACHDVKNVKARYIRRGGSNCSCSKDLPIHIKERLIKEIRENCH